MVIGQDDRWDNSLATNRHEFAQIINQQYFYDKSQYIMLSNFVPICVHSWLNSYNLSSISFRISPQPCFSFVSRMGIRAESNRK